MWPLSAISCCAPFSLQLSCFLLNGFRTYPKEKALPQRLRVHRESQKEIIDAPVSLCDLCASVAQVSLSVPAFGTL